ncbi:MAG: proline--tRNA ligase [Candidatus Thermoplasmatota archaeon]|nr:proline--tRNA ligase [Candidatus Thermoplasmatota archaeon]
MEKQRDFSEWYIQSIDNAGMVDKRYPIKGMNVWTPYGLRIARLMNSYMREEMSRTHHEEVLFPVLVPEDQFLKEADHIKGFEENVYWVTHGGLKPLDVRLLLRPTSETAMYSLFSLWVRSHTDLPLKVYQIVSVFRYETRQTRTFLRVRELSFFFESHTCHVDQEDAERQIEEDLKIWKNLAHKFALPYLLNKRPDWDKFPGAHYSVVPDTYVAAAGRALQMASMHHYRDNFSKVYDITFEDSEGQRRNVHQTTYGMSERILGAIVAIHGDDLGIVLPPDVAPIQVVIIPILAKGQKARVTKEARAFYRELAEAVRSELDSRNMRPGPKFYEWERKGVPLRVEIGVEEIEGGHITLCRRDTGRRRRVKREVAVERIVSALRRIQADMEARAHREMKENIHTIGAYDETPSKGIIRAGWCGRESCGLRMEERLDRGLLGTPFFGEDFKGHCLECGEETTMVAYAARSF